MSCHLNTIAIVGVVVFSLTAAGTLITAAATSCWIEAIVLGQNLTDEDAPDVPDKHGHIPPFTGHIQFGIFKGQKIFNCGDGQSDPVSFSIYTEHADVYSMGYPISVFIFMVVAIICVLISAYLGLIIICTGPIETINAKKWMIGSTVIADLAIFIAWFVYFGLYTWRLDDENILNEVDTDPPNNFRTSSMSKGDSFAFVECALLFPFVNVLLLSATHKYIWRREGSRRNGREMDVSGGANNIEMHDVTQFATSNASFV